MLIMQQYDKEITVIATVGTSFDFFPIPVLFVTHVAIEMPKIPSNVPLSMVNQYRYFCDCRHPKTVMGRWKATKAEYLSQNRLMKRPEAQARRIYEIRRQMAHNLGC